jgi:hypothetical protein
MNNFPDKQTVERVRKSYPQGTRVELTAPLDDPYSKLTSGSRGTVTEVYDNGDIGVAWDEGGSPT